MVDRKVAAIMAKPKGDDSSEDKEEVEMNDKKDCHQMRQKLAKKSRKGNWPATPLFYGCGYSSESCIKLLSVANTFRSTCKIG